MKIRNGFVSNSSSSSFIIAVPTEMNTLGQLQDYLFGYDTQFVNPYASNSNNTPAWPASDIAAIVFNDLKETEPKDKDDIVKDCSWGWTVENDRACVEARSQLNISESDMDDLDTAQQNKLDDLERKLTKKYTNKRVDDFIKKNPECFFYTLEYSDGDGTLATAMEHGGLFDKISHIKISNH